MQQKIVLLEKKLIKYISDPELKTKKQKIKKIADTILISDPKSKYARYTKAIDEVEYAMRLAPLSNLSKAKEMFKDLLIDFPSFLEASLMLAKIYKSEVDIEKEFETYKNAYKYDSENYLLKYELANLYLHKVGDKQKGMELFHECVEKFPTIANNWSSLGIACLMNKELETANMCFNTAIAIDPENLYAKLGIGVVHFERGEFLEAKKHYKACIGLKDDFFWSNINIAFIELLTGDFQEGLKLYECRDKELTEKKHIYGTQSIRKAKKEDIEKNDGKKLLVLKEQGYGDDIMFSRYLKDLSALGYQVSFICHKEMTTFFKCFPELKDITIGDKIAEFDITPCLLKTYSMSMPYMLSNFLKDKPKELKFDVKQLNKSNVINFDKIKETCNSKKLKIAFSWGGNPKHKRDKTRGIDLEVLSIIFDNQNFEFYAVQKTILDDEKIFFKKFKNVKLCDHLLDEFSDTAMILSKMDLVITIDTSIVHCAGAMGIKTLLLTPFVPDWRWGLKSNRTEWYQSVKLLRQESLDDWSVPLKKTKDEMTKFKK